jgi:hypothetical protein
LAIIEVSVQQSAKADFPNFQPPVSTGRTMRAADAGGRCGRTMRADDAGDNHRRMQGITTGGCGG